ncbi:MAG TPA: alpha/beta hydrolase [Opitutaceae bacterium]
MKTLSLVIFGLVLLSGLRAAEPRYRVLNDQTFLAPERKEKLDLYLPEPPPEGKLSPALVWIHGGGWKGGTKNEARAKNICGTVAAAGYVAVSIDYVLGEGAWPANIEDCKNAVRWVRANAAKYRIDPNRIAVAGGSAGGHLALMVALTPGIAGLEPSAPYPGVSSEVRCVVNFYGITNLLTRKRSADDGKASATQALMASSMAVFGAKSPNDAVLKIASPVTHVSTNSVPMLTFHGKADPTVDYPQAVELDRVAKERGASHELVLLDKIGHTFDLQTWAKKPLPRDLRPEFLAFLEKNLK